MDEHTPYELAYKNGYEKGKQDAMKWIPVTERLPEDRQGVLCCCGCDRIYHNIIHFAKCLEDISYDFEGLKRSGFYDYDGEWGYYEVTDITHWMPLPEPPKGE
jgi:hypothetical protein